MSAVVAGNRVVSQSIVGEFFTVAQARSVLEVLVEVYGAYPQELRIAPAHYHDYLDSMRDFVPRGGILGLRPGLDGPFVRASFYGIPLVPWPRAPLMTLLAVYPPPAPEE